MTDTAPAPAPTAHATQAARAAAPAAPPTAPASGGPGHPHLPGTATAVQDWGGQFFHPNATYVRNLPLRSPKHRPQFICLAAAVHPSNGELRAFGFWRPGADSDWGTDPQTLRDWREGWIEVEADPVTREPIVPDHAPWFVPVRNRKATGNSETSAT
jgi:hypothetical protein